MLKSLAMASAVAVMPERLQGQASVSPDWKSSVLTYLESLARLAGGYGWDEQSPPHLTPTFAVIGCHHALGVRPPHPKALATFVRTHHPSRLKKLEQEHREFEFQQIQALVWLGEEISDFRDQVGRWKKPTVYLKQYEQHGYPVFANEIAAFTCRALLGLPIEALAPAYVAYLDSRRRANGSFNATPAADGGDGHVINTWLGLQALEVLGRTAEAKAQAIEWLRGCQLPSGGFTWQPQPEFAAVDDAAYTWAATRALKMLGAGPAEKEACVRYIHSLANADGGFGDRPGWLSNPMASFYALEALSALAALDVPRFTTRSSRPVRRRSLPENLKVFSIQLEAHGTGSPAEAVDLARSLRIHLWGAKNATPKWLTTAQAIADQQNAPVRFFLANEEYGTWINMPGLGTYSHLSDIAGPAGSDLGPGLQGRKAMPWSEFRKARLAPLQQAGGRLIWQFGENEPLVRLLLDDSLERGGYAAISTFHFGNPDFTNSEPFLCRYRGQIPFVALQDAHGEEPWWFADMTEGFRTVFLAQDATWEGCLKALDNDWIAAIRHDSVSRGETWIHAGRDEVASLVRQQELAWRWWDNPAIQRPQVSVVIVRPGDEFEAARPDQGVTVRVRCAWENTTQGRPKNSLAELVKLTLDGIEVHPGLIADHAPPGGALRDHYHYFQLPEPAPGEHTVTAVVRVLRSNVTVSRTAGFTC